MYSYPSREIGFISKQLWKMVEKIIFTIFWQNLDKTDNKVCKKQSSDGKENNYLFLF